MLFSTETSIMTNLSDTQCILLSSASQRDDGSFYPLPSTLKPGGGTTKAPSKTTIVIGMLGGEYGATLPELMEVTGWLRYPIDIRSRRIDAMKASLIEMYGDAAVAIAIS